MEKYNRTLHSPISLGSTNDDRFMPDNYIEYFQTIPLVITEKLDGQNTCFNKHGLFARSHTSPSIHKWDEPLRRRWETTKKDLGEVELFGENMFATHGIEYSKLESYFYVFAVREHGKWLSWEEVEFYADYFNFPTVPRIDIVKPLSDFSHITDSDMQMDEFFLEQLGMTWEDYSNTPGILGGTDIFTGLPACEGLVVRNANSFLTNNGNLDTMSNEFDNVFKLVRENHVKTDKHWTKSWKNSVLTDYQKYGWWDYEYLKNIKK
jgi:hypothetical protein